MPMMAGRIDLTVGFGIVLWHILAMWLLVKTGIPWPLAVLIVLASGGAARPHQRPPGRGRADRFLHRDARHRHHALRGRRCGCTDGRQIIGSLPPGFIALNTTSILGIPIPAIYVMVLAVVLWIITERLPIGRHIYAIGANEKAAALNGIPVRAYVIGVFVGLRPDRAASPAASSRPSFASDRPMSASTICCRRWSAPSSARPRSSRAGSMSGAPSSAC